MTKTMKLRFAPSPTGMLHVGNARLAVTNYLFSKHFNATFLLRMDDTDTTRGKDHYKEAIKRDLSWLGLTWDEEAFQSQRLERYYEVIEELKARGFLYPCFESELELQKKRDLRLKAGRPPIYDRGMLNMTKEQYEQALENGKKPYWRFKLSGKVRHWRDLVMGKSAVKLSTLSDPVLVKADGTVLYTLASVIDDIDMGITHIIRGEDHMTNTGVQIDIAMSLGARSDHFQFAHLPLLMSDSGEKLSKRKGALSLSSLRQDGIEPLPLMEYLACLGTSVNPELETKESLIKRYDLSKTSRSPAHFDFKQLLFLNRHYLHDSSFEDVKANIPNGGEEFWHAIRGNIDLTSEIKHWHDVIYGSISPIYQEGEKEFLSQAIDLLPRENWDATIMERWIKALKEKTNRKGKSLFHPLRLALTGEDAGPELANILSLMTYDKVLNRLREACDQAS